MNRDIQTSTSSAPAARQEEQVQQAVVPPVDVYEDEHGITLVADLPGVAKDRLNVRVDGDALLLEASAATPVPEHMELVWGEAQVSTYRRRFTLSRELDTARIEAQLKDGVLRLAIPKAEAAKPRRIEVQAG